MLQKHVGNTKYPPRLDPQTVAVLKTAARYFHLRLNTPNVRRILAQRRR